ncbi:MAG: hypothetical protein LQ343_005634 [Gyalolechia ehrenbergii]|nr:MAG: hypothetical protein LQ343_005634 [Gyalolechia ehrenbergii]
MPYPNPGPIDTPSNHGPIVSVITWFLMAATILAVVARVLTKFAISRRLTSDDYMIFAALALSIGQGIAISLQTSNGAGRHQDALSASQLDKYYKCDYTSNLLFIMNLCFTKLSVLQMLKTITPVKEHIRMLTGVGAFVLVWSFASELVSAFQCGVTETWKPFGNKCIDRTSFWTSYGVLNLVTEAALVVLPLVIVWKIQTKTMKKAIIFLCFASRIMVLAGIIVQLIYVNRARDTSDETFDTWPTVLSAETVQSLSIITACIPCLKPFLESLESGMLRSDDLRRRGMGGIYGYGSHHLSELSSSKSNNKNEKSRFSPISSHNRYFETLPNVSTVVSVNRNEDRERDSDSQKSSSRIIKYTRTWAVE